MKKYSRKDCTKSLLESEKNTMPKLKQSDTQKICELLAAKVRYAMERKKISAKELALIWGIKKAAAYYRINHINRLAIEDLITLCKAAGIRITVEERSQPCVIGGD